MNYFKLLIFIVLYSLNICPIQAEDGKGIIAGKVIDKKTGEPLSDVTISLKGTSIKTITDSSGTFVLKNLPAGAHSISMKLVGYEPSELKNVKVAESDTTWVTHNLEASATELKKFDVVGARNKNTEKAVVLEIKKLDNIASGMSSQQITKSQDRDAADVVKRIPGVTIIDNRFIMIRGLSDRYNTVWLNGGGTPSAEADKKAFSFDIVPSNMIERILIFKTASADLPGDFAGGMVKIYTKTPTEKKPNITFGIQSSYLNNSTFKNYDYTPASKTDWLGFDNGSRSLPTNTPDYLGKNMPNGSEVSKSFQNSWAINSKKAPMDLRLNFAYSQLFKIAKKYELGNVTALSYTNTYTVYNIRRQDWDSTTQRLDYSDLQSTNNVRIGLIENLTFKLDNNNRFEFKNLLNQSGRSQNTLRTSNFMDGPNERSYALSYQDRFIMSSQLMGTHKSNTGKTEYTWILGYGKSNRNNPDLKRVRYTKDRSLPDSMYSAQVANVVDPVNGGGRFYSTLNEAMYTFTHNLKRKIKIKSYEFEANIGNYIEFKDRSFKARILGYVIAPGPQAFDLKRLPINSIFSPQNVGIPGGFKMDEITSRSDAYKAQNKLLASYLLFHLPVGKKIKISAGARYEYNIQALQSFLNQDSISPSITTKFLLPSANISYNLNKQALVRFAYGKTLNRPEFREWSPFYFYDFEFSAGTYGSLFPTVISPQGGVLKVATIHNFDLRYEYYATNGDFIHIGAFYKKFYDPIQQVILNSGGSDSRAFTFVNAESAYSAGIELDTRKNLGGLDKYFHTSVFKNFNLVGNVSFIKSQVYITKVLNQSNKSALQGQSPYIINMGLYYQDDESGLQFSLLYNVFGPRIFLLGTLDYANIGEMPRNTIDFSLTKKIYKKISLTVAAQNILNQPVLLIQDTNKNYKFERHGGDKDIMRYKAGAYFSAGIKYALN